ncbi:hypothetical protein BD324DRAFT_644144 [Kockovaella imperatae]|uniref:ATP-dependent DNA helicase n=1 Tax=Kockovaella imperatae TaxID=4999 RepID=A0A1Y1UTB1_9TREE|nr:hypothetical protein BD324DRAFT_644144 [Kockovaella imperatae]ORX40857.1 hypothetical protein BD324DRAFT_644144 [Kockovaella imperatae]
MSDVDFDDDDFLMDDSFLREVDTIEAKAIDPIHPSKQLNGGASKGWSGPRNNVASGSRTRPAGPTPSTRAEAIIPSSDDFDDFSMDTDALLALDLPQAPSSRPNLSSKLGQASLAPPALNGALAIPSSRLGMRRSNSSTSKDNLFQVHLNFRRADQTTKGKRWDRTVFAESGRRIDAERAKKKGKYKARNWAKEDDDDEDLDDDDDEDDEPLVPGPRPLVDTSAPYGPQKHMPHPTTMENYIYPTNKPKRDYQWDIIRACFTDNCLVALPTGLGKTFVAGVVMLNFYRWFPTGKIVFLAPTKPLVNQQIEACQMTCGIPSSAAAVMTGQSVPARERVKLWADRRVFYCTPQTLDNDLKTGAIDPRDIVLVVFDEAHKASGSYAYTTILAYITAQNPYFRVLALTATPGADVPRVQAVVDALHISRIEIREAEEPEIRKYMNEKRTEKHTVFMGEVIEGFRDRWAALMRPYVQKLVDKDILNERDLDVKRLKPFRLTAKRMEIARDRHSSLKWCFGSLQALEKMARAMGHLLEFSLGMFHTTLQDIAGGVNANGKKASTKGNSNALRNNYEFTRLLRDVDAEMNSIRIGQRGKTRADRHPKMVKTLELLIHHFTEAQEDEEVHGVKNDTRAMVFCSFRECVMEIVEMLNDHPGLLRATKFVGQSQGKQEADKGFNQKEQKKTIADFKEGKFNVLVSTSIGEEGLDIGEVDFVVIYDMPKQSIKLLQRIGRTGRKRDGKVHVLMSEEREDANWDKAQRSHRDIQEEILHSRNLELFEDVERLLPGPELPECLEQLMPVDPWDPEDQKLKRKLPSASKERTSPAKKKHRGHEIPEGGHEGFRSVAELLKESGKAGKIEVTVNGMTRGKIPTKRSDAPVAPSADDSDEDVEENHELLYGAVKPKVTSQSRRTAAKVKKAGPRGAVRKSNSSRTTQRDASIDRLDEEEKSRKAKRDELNRSALDFFNVDPSSAFHRRDCSPLFASPPNSPLFTPNENRTKAVAHGSPDVESSPVIPLAKQRRHASEAGSELARPQNAGTRLPSSLAAAAGFSQIDAIDLSWDNDEDEAICQTVASGLPRGAILPPSSPDVPTEMALPQSSRQSETLVAHPRRRIMGISRPKPTQTKSMDIMPPPPIPKSSPDTSPVDPTQVIRRPGARRRAPIVHSSDSLREQDSPFVPATHVRRPPALNRSPEHGPSSPIRRPGRRLPDRAHAAQVKGYLDVDAEVSGSDSSDEPSTDEETESDRLFAGQDFAPTQAPKGYNQRAVYAAGLSTQAAPRAGLQFKTRGDKNAFMAKARKPVLVTDDERSDLSENEYELGSFVCNDEDVSFNTQSDPMSGR